MKSLLGLFLSGLFFVAHAIAIPLNEGVPAHDLSANKGDVLNYEIAIPSGVTHLDISIANGSGDADIYVRASDSPSSSNYDCRPYLIGNNESCEFSSPQTTTYFIQIKAYESFSGVMLLATYSGGSSHDDNEGGELSNGEIISNLSGDQNSQAYFEIHLPSNATGLDITIANGSGDADLYVRKNSAPILSHYDCRPYQTGNMESCSFPNSQASSYYILIHGYDSYSDLSLSASYSVNNNSEGNDNSDGATWSGFETYYSNAIGQNGITLINALNEAASRHHSRMSYSQVWDALKYTDEDPNNSNNVILIYTGRSQAKTFNASGNNNPDAWNREHSWPKSHGFPNASQWAYTDIHHLRPADASVNSSRSNKDYDDGGNSIGEAPGNYTDSDSFEPRDEVKGDLARMMFYMDVRYNGGDNSGTGDLVIVDYTNTNGSLLGKICTLLDWHNLDPVSTEEINRHAKIVERQGNRNPFVDYPAWANDMWGAECD
ncbi:MAG: endonuclease [Cellvibrionaceae bacterium]